jgi:hypothetical protein
MTDRVPSRGCYLTTTELHRLDVAVAPLSAIDSHGLFLVGSVGERPDFRDVDVRLILGDDEFDAMFGHSPELWSVFCYAVSRWLSADTELPIDFQVQRQTQANEKHSGQRNHLGSRARYAMFAGRGDATWFFDGAPIASTPRMHRDE